MASLDTRWRERERVERELDRSKERARYYDTCVVGASNIKRQQQRDLHQNDCHGGRYMVNIGCADADALRSYAPVVAFCLTERR